MEFDHFEKRLPAGFKLNLIEVIYHASLNHIFLIHLNR